MNNQHNITDERLSGPNVQWMEYPADCCFECRVGLIREVDGTFSVYAINLPGIASQGENEQEALANITEALSGALLEYKKDGPIPWNEDFIDGEIVEKRVMVNLSQTAVAGSSTEQQR